MRSDVISKQSIAVHTFRVCILASLSVDEMPLSRYMNWSINLRRLLRWVNYSFHVFVNHHYRVNIFFAGRPYASRGSCLLIGIILRWGFLIWELIFIYCGLLVLILVVSSLFCFLFFFSFSIRFGQISPLAFIRWFTATSDRNAESCNRNDSN